MTEDLFVLPASFGQQRLWLLEQIQPDMPLYNEAVGLRLRGRLEPAALAQAMTEVLSRHEVLRTVLELDGAEVVQVVRAPEPVELPVSDLGSYDEAIAEARRLALIPFDLGRGPLIRCRLMRVAPEEHLFAIVVHHAVADGWSLGVMLHELTTLYPAATRGESLNLLPELPVQYADFAAWQKQRWDEGELAGQLEYWRGQLEGTVPLRLPVDHAPTGAIGYDTVHAPLKLPAAMIRQLRAIASDGDVTPFMVVLAAYAAVLSRWTRQQDVVVGLPFAGRSQADLEPLVGFFVNTLPVRLDLSGDPGFLDLLRQVRERCLGAYQHAEVPFELLVNTLKPERRVGQTPLAQTMLAVNNTWLPESVEAAGLTIEPVPLLQERAHFEVTVDLDGSDDALSGSVVLQSDLFGQETADLLAKSIVSVLRTASANPGAHVSTLSCPLADQRSAAEITQEPAVTGPVDREPSDGLPRTSTEVMLSRLWADVLELDTVGVNDEFYAAGGNSLRAVRVVMRARELGVELPVEKVLGEHTIRELAATV
ncbi:condensation domain-containing protein [Streptomyces sp. NBC_01142]|uniref:condensation domain-containing protein n=1 Tax=Streptomyces sp. NBC_01142 TaxID=2975865 RepID=UPI0022593DFC|nr:condensation domain-containing protein [Streptomyces sp. NBC_01142]MCX4820780.1 condensation domain-containing protein [Streptomyces sp. NBC_01142]